MKLSMDSLCIMFSKAFDIIEKELVGVSLYHSMRVGALCAKMGKACGYDNDTLMTLITCALFHDNALTEYTLEQRTGTHSEDLALHCIYGQRNIELLPLPKSTEGIILYHHSIENGTGPFGKCDIPLDAALIGAADHIDAELHLQQQKPEQLSILKDKIAAEKHEFSTSRAIEILLDVLDTDILQSLKDENIYTTLQQLYLPWYIEIEGNEILRLAEFISFIIDCKSKFTRKHSRQIANRAWYMSGIYGDTPAEQTELYFAAALHDLGKIATPSAVLEKPGKLDEDEYRIITDHVRYTYEWLGEVEGLGKIRDWASNHHEKLDGTGYSRRIDSQELDFNSRLLACLDIYQAVCEERPYHAARSHDETMPILKGMADKGFIDPVIVGDLDDAMAQHSLKDLPSPLDKCDTLTAQ